MGEQAAIGSVAWVDLTAPDAEAVRGFYTRVVGLTSEPVDMGGYEDFNLCSDDGAPRAGVCWKRGANAEVPTQWLIYFRVADLEASLASCCTSGGEVLRDATDMGRDGRYAVIRDPVGAVAALFQAGG